MTATMTDLVGTELLRAYLHIEDDDLAAETILSDLRAGKKATVALLPVIAHAIADERRKGVRRVEDRIFGNVRTGRRTLDDVMRGPSREELLNETVPLGNGIEVPWGKCTAAQHKQRIGKLEAGVAGTLITIKRHQDAIETIEAHGVECLNDIPADAL